MWLVVSHLYDLKQDSSSTSNEDGNISFVTGKKTIKPQPRETCNGHDAGRSLKVFANNLSFASPTHTATKISSLQIIPFLKSL